jgi:hypothetical protein
VKNYGGFPTTIIEEEILRVTKKSIMEEPKDWLIIIIFVVITIFFGVKIYHWVGDQVTKARERTEFMQRIHNPKPTPLEELEYEFSINDFKYEINVKRVK